MAEIKTWNGWNIDKELGSGAFGKVYQISKKDDFGNLYTAALKVISVPRDKGEISSLLSSGLSEKSATAYFDSVAEDIVKEAVILSELKGAGNIVGYEDNQYVKNENGVGGTIFIRMELLTPLMQYTRTHHMNREDIVRIGVDICKALEACQTVNIIHRDIKPENIFVSKFGEYKLGDFGIARTMEGTSSEMSKKGTFTYMAPEVFKGEAYDATVDTYSLGLVLYRYLNKGKIPFMDPDAEDITYGALQKAKEKRLMGLPMPKPAQAQDGLGDVILKACAYKAEDRFQSPREFRRELERYEMISSESSYIENDVTEEEHTRYLFNKDVEKEEKKEEKKEEIAVPPADDPSKHQEVKEPVRDNKKAGGSKGIIMALAALAVVAVVAIIALSMLRKKPDTGKDSTKTEKKTEATTEDKPEATEESTVYTKSKALETALANCQDAENPPAEFGGHAYAIFNYDELGLKSFDECEEYCEAHQGHLAVINSQEENDTLYKYIRNQGLILAFFGYTDQEEEGVWKWVDGSTSDYTNWCQASGMEQPNNLDGNENYAQYHSDALDGTWNDAAWREGTFRFICEWE